MGKIKIEPFNSGPYKIVLKPNIERPKDLKGSYRGYLENITGSMIFIRTFLNELVILPVNEIYYMFPIEKAKLN